MGQGKNGSRGGSREALRQPRAGTGVVHGALSTSCARRCINTRLVCTDEPHAHLLPKLNATLSRVQVQMSATCLRLACDLPCVCFNCVSVQPATARVAAMLTQERAIDAWLRGGTASHEIGQQQGRQSQDCHGPAKLLDPCQFIIPVYIELSMQASILVQ